MDLIIRDASPEDMDDVAEISRKTWEGNDYLENVSSQWLNDSGFIAGELGGRVIACGKITGMPGKIAWLEGLRVHPDFRGNGYGRVMSQRILDIALMKVESGEFSAIEFSTYINNVESRIMAERQGFAITEFFHVVGLDGLHCETSAITIEKVRPSASDFSVYPEHAPCGWKFIHHSAEGSLDWMRGNAEFWQASTGARFLASARGAEISPLTDSLSDPTGFIRGAFALAGIKKINTMEMMIHDGHREILSAALNEGFAYWETPGEANLPVYRFTGK